jgi:hypothetical protein
LSGVGADSGQTLSLERDLAWGEGSCVRRMRVWELRPDGRRISDIQTLVVPIILFFNSIQTLLVSWFADYSTMQHMTLFIRLIIRTFQLVFLARTVFFSHNKSANSVFQSTYQHSRTGPYYNFAVMCLHLF